MANYTANDFRNLKTSIFNFLNSNDTCRVLKLIFYRKLQNKNAFEIDDWEYLDSENEQVVGSHGEDDLNIVRIIDIDWDNKFESIDVNQISTFISKKTDKSDYNYVLEVSAFLEKHWLLNNE